MRELQPLHLPNLVASRTAPSSPHEDSNGIGKASHCPQLSDVSLSSISDASTPSTPTFSVRGHSRFPSASSTLTSTSVSPICEHSELIGSNPKLPMPKLQEEPSESEDDFEEKEGVWVDPFDSYEFDADYSDRTTVLFHDRSSYVLEPSLFGEPIQEILPTRSLKRQHSTDSAFGGLTMRLNSLSLRMRGRKNSSVHAGLGIQTVNHSRPASSRSSSLTGSHCHGFDQSQFMPPTPAMSVDLTSSTPSSPIDCLYNNNIEEPIDRKTLSRTPLLPPMMNAQPTEAAETVQSPLQSPTIAEPNKTLSVVSSASETLPVPNRASPTLSTKPSIASFHHVRTSTLVNVDVPPLHLGQINDGWNCRLGHANFVIEPEPYLPDVYDVESCKMLVANWDIARQNYFKHRARTIEHYGPGSKTYKLTEEKWFTIDAQWKKYNAIASARASVDSPSASPVTLAEPAPLTNMPTLNDPRCDGKFPKLGDLDIVGPMERVAPMHTSPPSPSGKITTFFRSMFGRSRSATR